MAIIVPGKCDLLYRKREGEALIFLEALLQDEPFGKTSWCFESPQESLHRFPACQLRESACIKLSNRTIIFQRMDV